MQRRQFDDAYRERATLRDGTTVQLRAVQPGDKELLLEGFHHLSPQSRYLRFHAVKPELSAADLAYLTELDGENHVALGAVAREADGRECGLGVARFIRLQDRPNVAEAAVAVVDDLQGQGLGTLLLHRLVAAARERGIDTFQFSVLLENRVMLELLRGLAPAVRMHVEDESAVCEFPLPAIEPDRAATESGRGEPLYELLAASARNLVGKKR